MRTNAGGGRPLARTAPSAGRPAAATPRDVLILSAAMGEGHNAAARALTEAMRQQWPGCSIEQLDIVELRGRHFAEALRWTYSFQLRVVPGTYQWLYDVLCRRHLFTVLLKAVFGSFFGRRLARTLAGRDPDLIVSTYPLASAALDWLRAKRGYRVPTVTYIPAFHVHPVWTYPGIDLHFVMYGSAADDARTQGVESSLVVGAPPVRQGFGDLSRAKARAGLGLREDAFVVLMTGGAWGLGSLERGVRALVGLPPDSPVQVIAVCGKNKALRQRLSDLGVGQDRLWILGYVDTMPALMAAADVVVTNGAGVTVLEALRTPRPVIAFEPLAGHGRAATEVMERLDLALVCDRSDDLVAAVQRLSTDGAVLSRLEQAGSDFVRDKDLEASMQSMAALVAERQDGGSGADGAGRLVTEADRVRSDGSQPAASPNGASPDGQGSSIRGGDRPHRDQPGS
jgi:diacylglycerol O-acyltransferase / wax synthase